MPIGPILRSIARSPSGALLISLQIALTLAIVSNSVFIIKQRLDKMARPSGIVEAEIITTSVSYFGKQVDHRAQAQQDLHFLKNQPGILDATYMNAIPLGDSGNQSSLCTHKDSSTENACPHSAAIIKGGADAISTLGLKLISGRNFRAEEISADDKPNSTPSSTVLILTQALAERYFPEGDALGKTLYIMDRPHTVTGIVERMQSPWVNGTEEKAEFTVLLPSTAFKTHSYLVIRAQQELIPALKQSLAEDLLLMNDRRVIAATRTLADLRSQTYSDDKAMIAVLITVIILLVAIAALGTGGLVSFSITNRHKQIGVRRALGARKIDILGYFLTEIGLICCAGLALGAILALGLNQYLMGTYELSRIEPSYIVIGMGIMLFIAQAASFFPARSASDISPAISTRTV